jgi:hypothetical protein
MGLPPAMSRRGGKTHPAERTTSLSTRNQILMSDSWDLVLPTVLPN